MPPNHEPNVIHRSPLSPCLTHGSIALMPVSVCDVYRVRSAPSPSTFQTSVLEALTFSKPE